MFFPIAAVAQNEWVLQPWMQVIGELGERLGLQVGSMTPRPNLPYKATISKIDGTGFYSLESLADTIAKRVVFGESVLTGDLNNDGHTDMVTVKRIDSYDTVFVFWGTSVGLDTVNPLVIPNESPSSGFTVGCIADINNDGVSDLVLTAPNFSRERGKVYFYLGPNITSVANATLVGDVEFIGMGVRVAIGDLNKDGFNDIIIRGHENWQNAPSNKRYDYINLYWGTGVDQLNLILGVKIKGNGETSQGLAVFDVNGDGIDDILWTNKEFDSNIWVIFVHFGKEKSQDFKTTPDLILREPTFAGFTSNIVNGGDMNGDGYNNVVVGATGFQNIYHYVLVYSGGPNMDGKFDAAVGTDNASYFGQSLAAIGDVNGDGLADILVGAPNWGRFAKNENKGFWGIFLGDRRIPASSTPEPPIVPKEFKLNQNYPNPFNASTVITYSLPFQSHITIRLFDLLGREVDKVRDGERAPGDYYFRYTPNGLPTGLYIYRLEAENASGHSVRESKKMLIVR